MLFNQTLVGKIKCSDRNGENVVIMGDECANLTEVGTVDCQCLIVHSSLIEKYNLRFDENLSFDLYTEDFSIYAREHYNIPTKIMQVDCHHYSFGKLTERFANSYKYLQNKYKKTRFAYITTCSLKLIGNGFMGFSPLYELCRFLWRKKIDADGTIKVKILGIPLKFNKHRYPRVNPWFFGKAPFGAFLYSSKRS